MDAVEAAPDLTGNACAGLTPAERDDLWKVACILADSRGLLVRIAEYVGGKGEWISRHTGGLGTRVFGENWQLRVQDMTERALWRGYDMATIGMDTASEREPWMWFNKALAGLSGAAGGFFGMPGLAVDIPASTMMIMRSIAEIARANGEDIGSEPGKMACLEVFALGGPTTEDDDVEIGYWSTRAALNHATVGTAIRFVGRSFGLVLSEKLLAQAVPVAGAVAGSALNYLFMDFYQQMARVHFTIRRLEREAADPSGVRPCFDRLVAQARGRRRRAAAV
jgi:hypothetical protein